MFDVTSHRATNHTDQRTDGILLLDVDFSLPKITNPEIPTANWVEYRSLSVSLRVRLNTDIPTLVPITVVDASLTDNVLDRHYSN